MARQHAQAVERERLRQQADRRRRVSLAAATAALVLVAIAAALGYGLRKAQAERDHQRSLAYAADMNLAQHALSQNNLGRALGLQERHRPKAGERDLRGWEWRYLLQQCRSDELLTLTNKSRTPAPLAVSADGKWLAVGEDEKGGLSIWDLVTRQESIRLPAGESMVVSACSPRELLLAFGVTINYGTPNQRSSVRLWDVRTRRIIAELPLSGKCAGLAFSGDGRTLLTAAVPAIQGRSRCGASGTGRSRSLTQSRRSAPCNLKSRPL